MSELEILGGPSAYGSKGLTLLLQVSTVQHALTHMSDLTGGSVDSYQRITFRSLLLLELR